MIDPVIEPTWIDYAIIAMLTGVLPAFSALVTMPRLKRMPPDKMNRLRPRLYVQVMGSQWLFLLAALYPVIFRGIDLPTIGVSLLPEDLVHFGLGAVVLIAIVFGVAWYHGSLKEQPEAKEMIRDGMKDVEWIIPRTRRELKLWGGLSLHAGVGEELFFRGYLLAILNAKLPFWLACIVMIVMFGLGHAYQGWRGIVKTAIASVVFLALYLWTGSLWLSMALHTLVDFQTGALGHWALSRDHNANEYA